jgi:hypothetical protein
VPARLPARRAEALPPRSARTLASSLGCAARQYALPMTATELSRHDDGAALVAYLSQQDRQGP